MIKLTAQMSMRAVVNGKISAFLLQAGKPYNEKITILTLFVCIYKKGWFWRCSSPPPPSIYTVKCGQEMDLALVIAMNFMC